MMDLNAIEDLGKIARDQLADASVRASKGAPVDQAAMSALSLIVALTEAIKRPADGETIHDNHP